MDIGKYIERVRSNGMEKVYFKCPRCKGHGAYWTPNHLGACDKCDGTGIDPDKSTVELLFNITGLLWSAGKAYQCGNSYTILDTSVIKLENVAHDIACRYGGIKEIVLSIFESQIKDTFQDKMAQVCIQFFILAANKNIRHKTTEYEDNYFEKYSKINFGKNIVVDLYNIIKLLPFVSIYPYYNRVFKNIINFCEAYNFSIEKFIDCRLAYIENK